MLKFIFVSIQHVDYVRRDVSIMKNTLVSGYINNAVINNPVTILQCVAVLQAVFKDTAFYK